MLPKVIGDAFLPVRRLSLVRLPCLAIGLALGIPIPLRVLQSSS